MRNRETLLLGAIFAVAIVLRLALALVNQEANDDHLEVIRLLVQSFRHLSMTDCHECFHPKLYHAFCALLFRAAGINDAAVQTQLAQVVNASAGIATLALILDFLRRTPFSVPTRIIVFAMVAFNPRLIAINIQASNDTFAILFGTMALHGVWRFLESPCLGSYSQTLAGVALAIASKGTALVVGIALGLVFAAQTLRAFFVGHTRRAALQLTLLLGVMALAITIADYDFAGYDDYGGKGRASPLYFLERVPVARPGIVSIFDSYLTFRFAGLLTEPMITNDAYRFPWHRTSLWTQLYGRLHFAQFDSWPASWRTKKPVVRHVGRLIFALALLPTGCFFWGLARHIRQAWRSWRRKNWGALLDMGGLWPLVVIVGYTMFIIKFTHDYRDFSAMKVIYIFPGMFAFVMVSATGVEALVSSAGASRAWSRIVYGTFAALAALYVVDVMLLLVHFTGIGGFARALIAFSGSCLSILPT